LQEEDAWLNRGCHAVVTNATYTECECFHLTSFALLASANGLVGSEVARCRFEKYFSANGFIYLSQHTVHANETQHHC
jgi:hypothetical protein